MADLILHAVHILLVFMLSIVIQLPDSACYLSAMPAVVLRCEIYSNHFWWQMLCQQVPFTTPRSIASSSSIQIQPSGTYICFRDSRAILDAVFTQESSGRFTLFVYLDVATLQSSPLMMSVFIYTWGACPLQFIVDTELQIFEKLFLAILFYVQSFWH